MKLMRAMTWFDLALCAALAIPFIAPIFIGLLSEVSSLIGSRRLGMPGGFSAFFINLAGLFGVLWNIIMLTSVDRRHHLIDMVARAGVIGLLLWHFLFSNLPPIFLIFVATELIGAVVKSNWLVATKPAALPPVETP